MQKYLLFIGIDISKNWIDVRLTLDGKERGMPHGRFGNCPDGFRQMVKFAGAFAKKHNVRGKWLLCMEHTGVYTLPLCRFLEREKLDHVLENALQIKRSVGIRRGKSDRADAAGIARYIFLHHGAAKLYRLPGDKLQGLKDLLGLLRRLKKARTAIGVAARELKSFSPQAQDGLTAGVSDSTTGHLAQSIREVERAVRETIRSSEQLERLYGLATSVKGVSLAIGSHMLVYTHGFTAFANARQFASYAGLAPFGHSSGSSVNRPDRVSHLANKRLKALISNGAMCAIRHDRQLRAYYLRRIAEGKNKYLVQNNVKNKLVQRVFAVVKRGTPYVELDMHSS